ncbi:MAG: hypothetical protein ACFFAJ_06040 [Candidatus Hodarchaeota archaeon]
MEKDVILEELNYLQDLLDTCSKRMDDILSFKAGTIFWRLFFPKGQFMQQQSSAREAAAILVNIDSRLREMAEVFMEREHPLTQRIYQLLDVNLVNLAERLVELPTRAQYIIVQVENIRKEVEAIISDIEQ